MLTTGSFQVSATAGGKINGWFFTSFLLLEAAAGWFLITLKLSLTVIIIQHTFRCDMRYALYLKTGESEVF